VTPSVPLLTGNREQCHFWAGVLAVATMVANNAWLLSKAQADAQYLINNFNFLHLFQNDYFPRPQDGITNYTEASFPGYIRSSNFNPLRGPYKVQDGEYQFDTALITFLRSHAVNQIVYGFYVSDLANKLMVAGRFDIPFDMNDTASIPVILSFQEWSLSVRCP